MDHKELLQKWNEKAKRFRDAHYAESARLRRMHYLLGVPSLIVSTCISTTVFATLEKAAVLEIRLLVGSMSIIAATLTALHTFLRFAERAEAHRQAYVGFDGVSRHVEQVLCDAGLRASELRAEVDRIRKRLDELGQAPEIALRTRVAVATKSELPSMAKRSTASQGEPVGDDTPRPSSAEDPLHPSDEPPVVVPRSLRPPAGSTPSPD